MANPVVTFTMADGKVMKAELYPEVAPNTVNNFISLVKKGFYDGLIFHRVIKGFMIQGGDPQGTGMGGPGYGIKGEFAQNGVKNDLRHTAATVMIASGADKAEAIRNSFFGPVTPQVPASILQLHRDVIVIADEAALADCPAEA